MLAVLIALAFPPWLGLAPLLTPPETERARIVSVCTGPEALTLEQARVCAQLAEVLRAQASSIFARDTAGPAAAGDTEEPTPETDPIAQSAQLFERACAGGYAPACVRLGQVYLSFTPPDVANAETYFLDACQGGVPRGCDLLIATQLRAGLSAQPAQTGSGETPAPPVLALAPQPMAGHVQAQVTRLEDLCDQGAAAACARLAEHLVAGYGVTANPAEAEALFAQACDGGVAEGCLRLAEMILEGAAPGRTQTEALARLDQACDAGLGDGCALAGRVLLANLKSADASASDAAARFAKGCEAWPSSANACNALGVLLGSTDAPQNQARAAQLFFRACQAGWGPGCENLGLAYQDGVGVEAAPQSAALHFRQACQAGMSSACFRLAAMAEGGAGIEQDRSGARQIYQALADQARDPAIKAQARAALEAMNAADAAGTGQ